MIDVITLSGLVASITVVIFAMLTLRRLKRHSKSIRRNALLIGLTAICCVAGFFLSQWTYPYSSTLIIIGLPSPIGFWQWGGSYWADFVGWTTYLFFGTNMLFWSLLPLCTAWFIVPKREIRITRHRQPRQAKVVHRNVGPSHMRYSVKQWNITLLVIDVLIGYENWFGALRASNTQPKIIKTGTAM